MKRGDQKGRQKKGHSNKEWQPKIGKNKEGVPMPRAGGGKQGQVRRGILRGKRRKRKEKKKRCSWGGNGAVRCRGERRAPRQGGSEKNEKGERFRFAPYKKNRTGSSSLDCTEEQRKSSLTEETTLKT